jgi:hypothetical protein
MTIEWKTTVAAPLAQRRGPQPGEQVGLLDAGGHRRGDLEGAAQAGEASRHVGPHVGEQRKAPVLAGRVDRPRVAATPLDDARRDPEGWPPGVCEQLGEAHGGVLGSPAGSALLVAVVVPAKVEPGARPELEEPQRQARLAGDGQEAAQQRGAAAYLVGLHRAAHELRDAAGVALEHRPKGRPRVAERGVAADRRVEVRELRRPALQHDAVHSAQQPQGGHVALASARPRREERGGDAALPCVRRRAPEQSGVERRAQLATPTQLAVELRHGRRADVAGRRYASVPRCSRNCG